MHLRTRLTVAYSVGGLVNSDSIRIAIFGVRSADAINPDSIRIEVLVRTHLKCVRRTAALQIRERKSTKAHCSWTSVEWNGGGYKAKIMFWARSWTAACHAIITDPGQ